MTEAVQHEEVIPGLSPYRDFAPAYLKIIDKRGKLVPFHLNSAQLELDDAINAARAEKRPVRIIILKARQLGFSTDSLGRMYEYTTTRPGSGAFMAAHDADSTEQLFKRVRTMYDFAPERPMTRYSNKTMLDFANPDRRMLKYEPGLMSCIQVGTAGRDTLGRSFVLRYLHCSEVGFWENADTVLLSLEQTLPDDPETVEIIESTANGVGNEFHKRWKMASDPKTRGDWRAIFFAWWKEAQYAKDLDGGKMLPVPSCVQDVDGFKREEQEYKALYELDDRQLNWRRWAIVNKCGNKLDRFKQEYPTTPDEAFLTSGRPVFNQQKLHYRIRQLEAHDLRASVGDARTRFQTGEIRRKNNKAVWYPNPDGRLRVYRWPEKGRDYFIGADVAEGKSVGDAGDESTIQVLERYSWEQIAVWQGKIPVTEFAGVLELLGYWYNTAMLVPESNNHGHTVCAILEEKRYPRLYFRQKLDTLGNEPIKKTGWETNAKTRPMMIDALDGAVNENIITLHDLPTLGQMLTFVRTEKGRPEGDKGCLDDLVLALCISTVVVEWFPKMEGPSSDLRSNMPEEQKMVRRLIQRAKREYMEQHHAGLVQ